MLTQQTDNIVLGTDSFASNDHLSIFEEIKTLQKHFPHLELVTLLQWSTINGSRALQLDKSAGSFEKGKKPGVVLIEGVDDFKLNEKSASKRIL